MVTRYEVGGCPAVGRIGVDGLWTMMTMGKEERRKGLRVSAAATGSEFGATKGRVPELEIRAGLDDGLRSLCVRWPLADAGRVREWPLATGWLAAGCSRN